jgi:hypothetical protein
MEAMHNINEAVKEQMLDWVQHFIAQRKAALMKGKKGVATGALVNSFELEIDRLAKEEGIALLIAFDEAGRFVDMKPSSFEHDAWGRNAINRLEAWVQKRGLSGFMKGYLQKHPNLGERKGLNIQRIVSDIAWGIAISRTNGKFRRGKKWWDSSKTAGTYELINKVAAALPAPTLDTLKSQFNSKGYARAKGR